MSALLIGIPVTKTLIVPTLTARIAVLVNRDSLGMKLFVKVSVTNGQSMVVMLVSSHDFLMRHLVS